MAGYANEAAAYAFQADDIDEDSPSQGAEAGRATQIVLMRAAPEGVRGAAMAQNTLSELFAIDGLQPELSGHPSGAIDIMLALGVLPVVASAEGVRSASKVAG